MNVCTLCGRRPADGLHRLLTERNAHQHEVRAFACGSCLWRLRLAGKKGYRFWETGGRWWLP
jgi:hypothetical protein